MNKKSKSKIGQCVYCGRTAPITEDHVPPKNLFAKPRPSNLIKVPSCNECHGENKQVSQDDEYFRLMIVLREDVYDHPDIPQVLSTVMRSLKRPDKTGFTTSLLKNMHEVEAVSRGGVYLGRKPAYNVNLARLDRVATRIVKGLFFHEKGFRLSDEYAVSTFAAAGLTHLTKNVRFDLQHTIIQPLMSCAPRIVGNKVFSYRVVFVDKIPNVSAWLLRFYDRVEFLSFIIARDEMERAQHGVRDGADS